MAKDGKFMDLFSVLTMLGGLATAGLVNIPLLFVMAHFFGLYGIIWTQLLSDAVTSAVSYAVYRRSYTRLIKSQIEKNA